MLTLTLQPSEADPNNRDTYIADGVLYNNNYGSDFALLIGTQNLGKDAQTLFRTILRFDMRRSSLAADLHLVHQPAEADSEA